MSFISPAHLCRFRLLHPPADGDLEDATPGPAGVSDLSRSEAAGSSEDSDGLRVFLRSMSRELDAALGRLQVHTQDTAPQGGRLVDLTLRLDELALRLREISGDGVSVRPLSLGWGDIAEVVAQAVARHLRMVAEANVELTFECESEEAWSSFDGPRLQDAVNQLLSNAIKFTPPGGKIWVSLEKVGADVQIAVADSGPGIPARYREKVFERFFQVSEPGKGSPAGLGLGLHVAREAAVAHEGHLVLESSPGRGTVLVLTIPVRARVDEPSIEVRAFPTLDPDTLQGTALIDPGLPRLLVCARPSVQEYLRVVLGQSFNVFATDSLESAWTYGLTERPHVVIGDFSGSSSGAPELLARIRSTSQTSTTPYVVLSSRYGIRDQLEGFAGRADDVISLPVDPRVLLLRLQNLLVIRRRLEVTRKQLDSQPPHRHGPLVWDRLREHVEEGVSSAAELSVKSISEHLCLSPRTLQRRLKAEAGQSVGQYVRNARLRKAQTLLRLEPEASISEIARAVGMHNTTHFSYRFEKVFGIGPAEFSRSWQANTE